MSDNIRSKYIIWDNHNPTPGEHVTSEQSLDELCDNDTGLWYNTFVFSRPTDRWANTDHGSHGDMIFTTCESVDSLIDIRNAIDEAIKELS